MAKKLVKGEERRSPEIVATLIRIKLNTAYLRLGARNEGQAEVELLMRRKEVIDEVHQVRETEIVMKM